MKALQKFIDQENSWRGMFHGCEPLVVPTNAAEAEVLFEDLEAKLSPENLHCDGEISLAAARKKSRFFNEVWADLESIVGQREQCV